MSYPIKNSLKELYAAHQGKVSDKWSIYLAEYDHIFAPYREGPTQLLEIGIQNGGSLEIWSRYFPHAKKIVGCDINPDCTRLNYIDPRIAVVIGDANLDATLAAIKAECSQFDLVIDDGCHTSSAIVKSFIKYWPHIADGGAFVAEDLHCSYWQAYGGGLYDPYSSIAFFKRLFDVINYEHWGIDKTRIEVLAAFFKKYGCELSEAELGHIHSIEFINSMCVIRKQAPSDITLGPRFIAGSEEVVFPGFVKIHMSSPVVADERTNPWAICKQSPDQEFESVNKKLEATNKELLSTKERLNIVERELHNAHQQIKAIYSSNSWQLARPLRFVSRQIRRIAGVI